jgi:hypothetical protein
MSKIFFFRYLKILCCTVFQKTYFRQVLADHSKNLHVVIACKSLRK